MYDQRPAAEITVCRHLIRAALKEGFAVSVYDGEEWACKRSTSFAEIMDALGNTDTDKVLIRDAAGVAAGSFFLVWGNAPDELISDYSDNEVCQRLTDAAVRFCKP